MTLSAKRNLDRQVMYKYDYYFLLGWAIITKLDCVYPPRVQSPGLAARCAQESDAAHKWKRFPEFSSHKWNTTKIGRFQGVDTRTLTDPVA